MMMFKTSIAAVCMTAASFVLAQPQVVDRNIPPKGNAASSQTVAQPSSDSVAEMYYQMQVLQQEVLQLRGMVEEQAFEIKKLKQQRLDDYVDLDRRISQLSAGGVSSGAVSVSPSPGGSNTSSANEAISATAKPDEMKHYRSAMNLVLKKQDYDGAIASLEEHLRLFPNGRFSANAQYWLGEVYIQKEDLNAARDAFKKLLLNYSDHPKVPDAEYKLGVVYHKLGDMGMAKTMLNKVAATDTSAAKLARDYLKANLSN